MGGDVHARGVDELPEVAEGQLPTQRLGVVDVEGAPSPVTALHALDPGEPPLDGGGRVLIGSVEREHDLGGVVDVGVVVVGEFEGPAARGQRRPADGPVARDGDLLGEQVARRRDEHRVTRSETGVGEGGDGQGRVPDRGLASFEAPPPLVVDRESVKTRKARPHAGVVEGVALQPQGDQ